MKEGKDNGYRRGGVTKGGGLMHSTNAPVLETTRYTLLDPKGVSSGLSTIFLEHALLASVTKPEPHRDRCQQVVCSGPCIPLMGQLGIRACCPAMMKGR